MTDDHLSHVCKLSAIAIESINDPTSLEAAIRDGHLSDDPGELRNTMTCLRILAKTTTELMRRQGIKPVFRVKAYSEAKP